MSRIVLAVGFYAGACPERWQVLERSLLSARASGASACVLLATGEMSGILASGIADGLPLIGAGDVADLQQGEAAIGSASLRVAESMGAGWLVKVAGDTFHPCPGWARALAALAEAEHADLLATAHHFPGRANTQVFCVRPAFMRATWPGPQDPALVRTGIEPAWGARIAERGLSGRWHRPEAVRLEQGACVNFAPREPRITYFHSHTWAAARQWRMDGRPEQPAPPAADLSIVIPARNETQKDHEGRQLLVRTIESIAATSRGGPMPETIIVDDGSDQELPIVRPDGLPLRVLRNAHPLGVDPSRNIGGAAASGNVIGILDAHCVVQTQEGEPIPGGLQRLASEALERNAIVCGRCAHLELTGKRKNNDGPIVGGQFTKITRDDQGIGMDWYHVAAPATGVRRINGLLGACYFMPRAIWQELGGFIDCLVGWGYSEEGLALKAAFLEIPIFGVADVTISHWFRSTGPFPFPLDGFEKFMNGVRVMKLCFEPETWEGFWRPRPKRFKVWVWGDRHEQTIANDPALEREAHRFRATKIRTDQEIMKELFGVDL